MKCYKSGSLFSLLVVGALLFFAMGCQPQQSQTPEPSSTPATSSVDAGQIKRLLPDTVGQGKPVILDFSSKFCLACQQLRPKLEKLQAETPGLTLITIDTQKATEDQRKLMKAFGVTTVPYVAFINKDGKVTRVLLENTRAEELHAAVGEIMLEKAKP